VITLDNDEFYTGLPFQAFFENSERSLVLKADAPKFTILAVSKIYLALTHKQRRELLGKGLFEVYPGSHDDLSEQNSVHSSFMRAIINKTTDKLPVFKYKIYVAETDSYVTEYWTNDNEPLLDDDGNVAYLINTTTNITRQIFNEQALAKSENRLQELNFELTAANEELANSNEELAAINEELITANSLLFESEARFRSMAESSEIMITMNDVAGNVEYINQAWLNLTGKTLQEMLAYNWKNFVHPEDQPELLKKFNAGIQSKTSFSVEFRMMNSFGKSRWIYTKVNPRILANGSYAGTISSSIDVTELLETKNELNEVNTRLKIALDAGAFGSTEVDLATGKMIATEQFKQCFGRSKEQEFIYPQLLEAILPKHREEIKHKVSVALKNHTIYQAEYEVQWPDGSIHWISSHGRGRYDDKGTAIKLIGIISEITESKQDEQRKNDFISMVSHELKTPLTSMNGYIQILQSKAIKDGDQFSANFLIRAGKQMKKMTTIINGFLNVSRLESGKINIDKNHFDMAALIEEIEEEIVTSVTSHQIIFAPVKPTPVMADRDKIGQVISNLISNAVKYSPLNSAIHIDCITTNGLATVSVKDKGIGIAADDAEKLFNRYYRIKNQITQAIAGFGIGLYLCKEIIERHNGTIGVKSKIGKGSTFYFTLPVQQ